MNRVLSPAWAPSTAPPTLDARLKWSAIAVLLATVSAATLLGGSRLHLVDATGLAALALPLALAMRACDRRGHRNAAAFLTAVLQFTLFTCSYTAVTCIAAMWNRPPIDEWLVRADETLGVHVPFLLAWMQGQPVLDALLTLAYHSVVPQTLLVAAVLAFSGEHRSLELLLTRLMIAAVLTLVVFAAWPAVGPFEGYGYPPSPPLQNYVDYFLAFRAGERETIRFFILEGLITFPSFHAAWALLLAAAWHRPAPRAVPAGSRQTRRRWLLASSAVLNGAVLVSAVTAGGHYATDILAGLAIGLAAIGIARLCRDRLFASRSEVP